MYKEELKFRDLTADEIECRVSTVKESGCSLLLYKDARCDMNILDDTLGPLNWMRRHTRDNANCIVSIYDETKNMWIEKEDTGKESYTEKEKGLASDSFKRACFNWGIGRELYTAPFIWVPKERVKIKLVQGKATTSDRFAVEDICIEDKKIVSLTIKNTTSRQIAYQFAKSTSVTPQDALTQVDVKALRGYLKEHGIDERKVCQSYHTGSVEEMTLGQMKAIVSEKNLDYFIKNCGVSS